MRPETVASIAANLLTGELQNPWPADLGAAVRSIVDSLASRRANPSAIEIRNATRALNRRRHFEHSKTIGSAWHDTRGCDPTIQKHHAQALIELGALDAAEALITEASGAAHGSSDLQFVVELPEYRGLRGRIEKQRFVQSGDLNRLAAATNEYFAQYSAQRVYWHGINIVALRTEEERQGLPPRDGDATSQLAEEVLTIALAEHAKPGANQWPSATASEACLALHVAHGGSEWCDRAELWLHRFLNHPASDPFSVESYSRQLREIWRGDPLGTATCADRLAGILQRHVARTEQRWSIDAGKVQEIRDRPEVLEKNFSGEKSFTVENLKHMLGLCPSIGCVIDSTGARLGTGFLMAGSSFGFQQPLVFVTNAHVISDTCEGSIPSADAKVTFETESVAAGVPVAHAVDRILFTSDPGKLGELSPTLDKLDATIVALKTLPASVSGLKAAANIPLPSATSKAFVVGHPASGALQFSLHDSVLLDVCDDERLMHYRTPTDPGSSGSPVFNANWQVVALHHAGSPETPRLHGRGSYEANEGITVRAIRRKLGIG
jgi:Trypsin-like peptidase domain/Tetratricopeptide Repeats-Sensor